MIIDWKGKIGYGDIVSPICYAINQSIIRNEVVTLNFYWPYTKQDSQYFEYESLRYRADVVEALAGYDHLKVNHKFGTILPYNHTNYHIKALDPNDTYHNIYFPKFVIDPKYTVVCSPLNNKKQLKDYGPNKAWKDGLDPFQWETLIDQPDTIHVDYRTPINELIDIMLTCRHFIGYHGSCSWVARMFGVPMTIHSHDPKFTQWAFPWQAKTIEESKKLLSISKDKRNEYIERLRWI